MFESLFVLSVALPFESLNESLFVPVVALSPNESIFVLFVALSPNESLFREYALIHFKLSYEPLILVFGSIHFELLESLIRVFDFEHFKLPNEPLIIVFGSIHFECTSIILSVLPFEPHFVHLILSIVLSTFVLQPLVAILPFESLHIQHFVVIIVELDSIILTPFESLAALSLSL